MRTVRRFPKPAAVAGLVTLLVFGLLAPASADPPAKPQPASQMKPSAWGRRHRIQSGAPRNQEPVNKVMVTGSWIPHQVHRHGGITDGPQSLYILDREEIERSGAATTAQALQRLPFGRVHP